MKRISGYVRFVGPQSGNMMSQLTSPMTGLVKDVVNGQVQSYMDVIVRSN